jgi:hypothetical protein
MSSILEYVLEKVNTTQILLNPFPHIIISDIFPLDFYEMVMNELDQLSADTDNFKVFHKPSMKKKTHTRTEICIMNEKLDVNEKNQYFDFPLMKESETSFSDKIKGMNIEILCDIIKSDALKYALLEKFGSFLKERLENYPIEEVSRNIGFNRDTGGFCLKPHTDTEFKLLFGVLYLSKNKENPHLGTDLYKHKNGLKSWRTTPLDMKICDDDFIRVKQAEYLPNQFAVFLKNDESWHGVNLSNCNIVRHTIYYSLCAK